jgi:hypothetical protein
MAENNELKIESDHESETGEVSGPSRKRSAVWNNFSHVKENQVQCHICRDSPVYKGTTSNMLEHLRRKHPYTLTKPR